MSGQQIRTLINNEGKDAGLVRQRKPLEFHPAVFFGIQQNKHISLGTRCTFYPADDAIAALFFLDFLFQILEHAPRNQA